MELCAKDSDLLKIVTYCAKVSEESNGVDSQGVLGCGVVPACVWRQGLRVAIRPIHPDARCSGSSIMRQVRALVLNRI